YDAKRALLGSHIFQANQYGASSGATVAVPFNAFASVVTCPRPCDANARFRQRARRVLVGGQYLLEATELCNRRQNCVALRVVRIEMDVVLAVTNARQAGHAILALRELKRVTVVVVAFLRHGEELIHLRPELSDLFL